MAIAGKVAITPGGEWSVDVAYDKLVVVTFGNNVYLSIKPSTGIEPTNEEYWMLLIENVTQEQYDNIINGTTAVGNALKLNGLTDANFMRCRSDLYANTIFGSNDLNDWVSIHGAFCSVGGSVNVPSGTDGWGDIFIFGTDNGSHITQIFRPWNTAGLYWRYKYNDSWFDWKKLAHDADLANYLPKSGGTLSKGSVLAFEKTDDSTLSGDLGIGFYGNAFEIWERGGGNRGAKLDLSKCVGGTGSELLHTGNKPSGTYTGNGDATSRTIATGGIGKCLYIQGNDSMCFVGAYGGIMMDLASDGVKRLHYNEIHFENGVLTITTALKPNLSADDYYYEVL